MNNNIPKLHINTKWELIDGKTAYIYNKERNLNAILSESATSIIVLINGTRSVKQIVDILTKNRPSYNDYNNVSSFISVELYQKGFLDDGIIRKNKSLIRFKKIIKKCSQRNL